LETGTDLRYIHALHGRASSKTTEIFMLSLSKHTPQVSTKALGNIRSLPAGPLDDLDL
jgi:hypothetical protein